jgi:hypothetical protein
MNKIETLNKILGNFCPEDNLTTEQLRNIYDGKATPSDETVADFRSLTEDELTEEEIEAINTSTDEELRTALTEYFKNFVGERIDEETDNIREAVSDWFDDHCHSDDFDNEYQRQRYFRDLIDGNGDADYIYDEVIDEIEYEYMTEDEVSSLIDEAIVDEAEYWAD